MRRHCVEEDHIYTYLTLIHNLYLICIYTTKNHEVTDTRDTLKTVIIIMADPTLQTFCCHHTNRTETVITMMQEFNSDVYNAVCMISSTIGILGAIYQVIDNIYIF